MVEVALVEIAAPLDHDDIESRARQLGRNAGTAGTGTHYDDVAGELPLVPYIEWFESGRSVRRAVDRPRVAHPVPLRAGVSIGGCQGEGEQGLHELPLLWDAALVPAIHDALGLPFTEPGDGHRSTGHDQRSRA
jgi:hypothetical protein